MAGVRRHQPAETLQPETITLRRSHLVSHGARDPQAVGLRRTTVLNPPRLARVIGPQNCLGCRHHVPTDVNGQSIDAASAPRVQESPVSLYARAAR